MSVAGKLGAALALAYVGGVVYGKRTGAFGVGPSMHVGTIFGSNNQPKIVTQEQVDAWEKERTRRALRWPLSFIPSPFTG